MSLSSFLPLNSPDSGAVGIAGAGLIGCYVGTHLAAGGANVTFIGRERLGQLVKAEGLSSRNLAGKTHHLLPGSFVWTDDFGALQNCATVIVTLKSQDTENCAKDLARFLRPEVNIISLQNGVRNESTLRNHLPRHEILSAMFPFNVVQEEGRAVFTQATAGKISLDAAARRITPQILNWAASSGMEIKLVEDIHAVQWGKLLINLNNALNALCGLPLKEQLANREYRKIMAASMAEAIRIVHKCKIRVVSEEPMWLFERILRLPNFLFQILTANRFQVSPEARLSMWHDLELRRTTEVDYLNGEIVRLAREHGLSAPLQSKIVALIKSAEAKKQGSPGLSAGDLQNALFADVQPTRDV